MGFTVGKGSEKGLRRGSEKGVSRRCLVRPLGEYIPLGVCPKISAVKNAILRCIGFRCMGLGVPQEAFQKLRGA